jgi:hypothetical protein
MAHVDMASLHPWHFAFLEPLAERSQWRDATAGRLSGSRLGAGFVLPTKATLLIDLYEAV